MNRPATAVRRFADLTPTLLGFVGLAVSAVAMLGLHVVAIGRIDPVSTTLSDYVFVRDYEWLFPAAVLGIAAAGFAVLATLRNTLPKPGPVLRLSVALPSVCCLLVAAFPTTRVGPLTLSAQIHRYAAGVAFCCVPVAALLLAAALRAAGKGGIRARRLHRNALATSLLLLLVLTSQLGLLPEPVRHVGGLFQRAQLLLQLLVLGRLLGTLAPVARSPRLPSVRPCSRRTGPAHVRGSQPRPGVVDTLPVGVGWPTVGVCTPTARSRTWSRNESPQSR